MRVGRPSGGGEGPRSARLQNRTPCTSPALPEVWDLIDSSYRVDPTLQLVVPLRVVKLLH